MNFETLFTIAPFVAFAVLLGVEKAFPGRAMPRVPLWTLRGVLYLLLTVFASGLFPLLWDAALAPYQLFDLKSLGIVGGAIVGALILEGVNYAWHRALHRSDFLWRWLHQLHHSAERFDVASSMHFSPLDTLGWSAMGSLGLVLIVGIDPWAAALVATGLFVLNVFSHANLRTPKWIGYFVARPEAHAIHHERGVHAYNYATLPVWDIIFGTFKSPPTWEGEVGFYPGASARVPEMLIGRDVSEPRRSV